jgi:hypothetical protein
VFTDEPNTPRRRWVAITVATLAMQFSYWGMQIGVSMARGEQEGAGGPMALSLGVAPFVFLIAAAASRHRALPMATLKGMGLFLVFGSMVGLGNPMVGMVAGFSAGATVSLRREPEEPLKPRVIAAVAATVWVGLLFVAAVLFSPAITGFAIMSGAVLPFAAVGIADQAVELRALADAE